MVLLVVRLLSSETLSEFRRGRPKERSDDAFITASVVNWHCVRIMPLGRIVLSAAYRQPLLTGVLAAGIKGALADITSQHALQGTEYKPSRTVAFALWNATYCGFGVYGLYSKLLPRMWPIHTPSGMRHPLAARHTFYSVSFDNFFATPFLCMPTYYACHCFVEGSWEERKRPIRLLSQAIYMCAAEARETLALSWSLWIPIHVATFTLIPVPLRTHWVAACSFVTLTCMSFLQSSLEERRASADTSRLHSSSESAVAEPC